MHVYSIAYESNVISLRCKQVVFSNFRSECALIFWYIHSTKLWLILYADKNQFRKRFNFIGYSRWYIRHCGPILLSLSICHGLSKWNGWLALKPIISYRKNHCKTQKTKNNKRKRAINMKTKTKLFTLIIAFCKIENDALERVLNQLKI